MPVQRNQQNLNEYLANYLFVPISEVMFSVGHPKAEQAFNIIDQLISIDNQLAAARVDSMAETIGAIKVNYPKHVAHLRNEGSLLVNELSKLTGINYTFDKYHR